MCNGWVSKLISPSRLDEFIQFQSGVNFKGDEYTLEVFIDKLLKIEPPSDCRKRNAGTAGHNVLELLAYGVPVHKCDVAVEDEIWTVVFDCQTHVQLPVIRESWVRGIFADVTIRGKVDAIDAISVHDHKFTSSIDIDKYMSSMQWKMYLLMTGRERFVYNLFTVKVDDDVNIVTIKDYQRLVLTAYDGMAEEVEKIISEYKDFLITITPLLNARVAEYNKLIDEEITKINDSSLVTIRDKLITVLNNGKLKLPDNV